MVVRPLGLSSTSIGALLLGAALLGGPLSCSSERTSPDASGNVDQPTLEGTVAVYTARLEDGTSETQYFLRSAGPGAQTSAEDLEETRLWFDADPELAPAAALRVWGDLQPDASIHVTRFAVDTSVATTHEALIGATPFRARTFGLVLVDIGGGVNLTAAEAQKRLFGTAAGDNSVKQYYGEASYGTQDITGAVLGPLSYPMSGCDTKGLASTLKKQLGVYDHFLWYMGSRTTACSWSGLAEVGLPSQPTNDSWYNGTAGCVVLVQEPGHNFGMQHSSSMTCNGAVFADNPDATCTHVEYGDKYDPMGGACNHMNAWQKVYEGWLQKCNAVKVGSSGTFTLQPLEAQCDGIQVLQIPMPKIRPFSRAGGGGQGTTENIQYYYLELRTARGFDQSIRTSPTVLVHVAEDFRSRTDRGRHTWILDMVPSSTRTIEGLGAGQSFTDPAGGVSFSVASLSTEGATINVTVPGSAGSTCLDKSTYDPNAPATCIGVATGTGGGGGAGGAVGAGGASSSGGAGTGSGGVGPAVSRVNAFTLINADTDTDVLLVNDGMTLDLDTLPAALTLRADTDPPTVGSVAFIVDGTPERVESISPYSVSSDDGRGNFAPWTFGLGTHTVTATPYGSANAMGTLGEALTVTFTLARGVPGTGGSPGIGGAAGGEAGAAGAAGAAGSAGAGAGAGGGIAAGGFTGIAGAPGFGSGGAPSLGGGPAAGGLASFGAAGFAGGAAPAAAEEAPKDDPMCACRVPGSAGGQHSSSGAYAATALCLGIVSARRGRRRNRSAPRG